MESRTLGIDPGWWVRLAAVVAVLVALGPASRAEDASDVESFEKEVEALHTLVHKERYDYGLKKLATVLETHARRRYVLARRAEIEDLAQRLAFGASMPTPTVGDVLGATVHRFNERTGKLACTYEQADIPHLVAREDGMLAFPGRFAGPFEIEIRGSKYDSDDATPSLVVVGGEPDPDTGRQQAWVIWLGLQRSSQLGRSSPSGFIHRDGDQEEQTERMDEPPLSFAQPYRVRVQVSSRRIEAFGNGKRMGRCEKPKDAWGYVYFRLPDWTEVKISGELDLVWMQNRVDQLVQERRETFRATWRPEDVLPAWLLESPEAGPEPEGLDLLALLPDDVSPGHAEKAVGVLAAADAGNAATARLVIGELEADGASPALCGYLAAQVSLREGRYAQALDEVEACLAESPEMLGGVLLKGMLLSRLGRPEEAERVVLGVLGEGPRSAIVYETACLVLLMSGRPEAAQDVTRRAAEAGVRSENLDQLARIVAKAIRGPTWSRTYEFSTTHYDVISDIDRGICVEAAKLLEDALASYRLNLEWVKEQRGLRHRVLIFSGQAGFLDYLDEIDTFGDRTHELAAGLYQPYLKQLVVWNLPSREALLQTLRHEGFHQYLDRLMPAPPVWFNEGLAVYHQAGEQVQGKLRFGQVHPEYLDVLKQHGLVPLREFLLWSPRQFYTSTPRSYAQAWAFVHMLREGSPEHRALFGRLIEDLQGEEAGDAVDRALTPEVLARLDQELEGYVQALRNKTGRR